MSFQWGRFSAKGLDFLFSSTARLNIADGSVRSSKTITSIVRWIEYVKTAPPGDLIMVGKTERTLKRNILDPLAAMVGAKRFRYNRGLGELFLFGRRIYIAGANDERAEGKIRGLTLAGAYGDEVSLWAESFFKMLLSRLSVKGAKLFATTNPDFPGHWLKTDYLDKAGLDLLSWHFTLDDNPNLDPAYVAALKNEYTGVWYQRFILGLWVAAEGLIYDAWSDANLFDDSTMPPGLRSVSRRYISVDYGTQNATVYLEVLDDGATLWIANEYYHSGRTTGRQKTDAEYVTDMDSFVGDHKPLAVIVDPSAASLKAALRAKGYRIKDALNDVPEGIKRTATLIAQRKILVHRANCPHLLQELAGYVWDEKALQRGVEQPLKTNDHCMDAARYATLTLVNDYRAHRSIRR